jgi:hypothetical protein
VIRERIVVAINARSATRIRMIRWISIEYCVSVYRKAAQNLDRVAVHDFAGVRPPSSPYIDHCRIELNSHLSDCRPLMSHHGPAP